MSLNPPRASRVWSLDFQRTKEVVLRKDSLLLCRGDSNRDSSSF